MKPAMISIAGPSCAGKSLLARRLVEQLSGYKCCVLPLDCYYLDLSALTPREREKKNFDSPGAIDSALLFKHLESLAAGGGIEKPLYDYTSHTRSSQSEFIAPSEIIIIEGLFALYWHRIRRMIRTGVFILLSDELALSRRLERDMLERGRSRESVLLQYWSTVKPMSEKYVLPTAAFADIVVDGQEDIEKSVARVKASIDNQFTTGTNRV